jgi:predicted dehydrogenase
VKFLVVGAGSIGKRHLRNLRALGETDLAVLRRPESRESAQDLERELGVATHFDLDAALGARPDAVLVANPTSLHMPVALAAARRGIAVFMEKPLSHTADGVDELSRLVTSGRMVFFIGFMMRYHPAVRTLKRLAEDGAIGRVMGGRFAFGSHLPDWHPWEDYRGGYAARRDLGGGAVLTLTHEIDLACHFLGEPARVAAMADRRSDLEVEAEDFAEILVGFRGGAIGSIHVDYAQRVYHRVAELYGTDGTLTWNWDEKCVRLRRRKDDCETFPEPPDYDLNTMYLDELRDFVAAVRAGESGPLGFAAARTNLAVALAALRASAEGKAVDL